ncbi:phage tail sheath subtilisin-like domain-containing protein [Citrobacter freundii]|uniref:phage tail sheath subtilisin-like domain-containing protein n=1 Tax=Citrobacter freundii TaxID=546 RepID=UPI00388DC614|nr:phage tail sheath subtilisin-like domain-containing protein [Citrobacter freundii]
MIPFSNVPSNLRTPLFYAEVDNSQANTATVNQNTLIIGQMLSTGTATADEPVICASTPNAKVLAGQGSMLASMMDVYLQNDSSGTIYLLPVMDAATGMTGAEWALVVTGVPTANGVISLYIAGIRVQVAVVPTDTSDIISGAIVTAIGANADLPVTAQLVAATADDPAKVKLTAKNKGALGNTIDIRLNYLGASGSEYSPPGVDIAITKMTGGAGTPDLTTALANLHDTNYDFIVFPYDDTTSLDAVRDFLNDQTGRWSYSQQTYGHAFGATSGTYGVLTAKGEGRNDQHASLMGVNDSPSPSYLWAAGYAGAAAVSLRNDPGRPLQTLVIRGVLAPPMTSRFSLTERNTLLYSGISTFTVQPDNSVQIENVITTYQLNGYGQPDDSYLQVETLFLLMFCMRDMRSIVTSKFGRVKLAKDGTRFAPGSALVTPSTIKAELIAEYQSLEWQGYVQDSKGFAAGLIVEQNASNPNRVDVLWDGILINQLRIFAVLAQFRLQPTS